MIKSRSFNTFPGLPLGHSNSAWTHADGSHDHMLMVEYGKNDPYEFLCQMGHAEGWCDHDDSLVGRVFPELCGHTCHDVTERILGGESYYAQDTDVTADSSCVMSNNLAMLHFLYERHSGRSQNCAVMRCASLCRWPCWACFHLSVPIAFLLNVSREQTNLYLRVLATL